MTRIKEKYKAGGEQEEKNDGANLEFEMEDDDEEVWEEYDDRRGGLPVGIYRDPMVGGSSEEEEEEMLIVDYSDSSLEETRDRFGSSSDDEEEEDQEQDNKEEEVQEEEQERNKEEESDELKEPGNMEENEDEEVTGVGDVIVVAGARDDAIEVIDLTSIASSPAETDSTGADRNIPGVDFFRLAAILHMLDNDDMVEDQEDTNDTKKTMPSSR